MTPPWLDLGLTRIRATVVAFLGDPLRAPLRQAVNPRYLDRASGMFRSFGTTDIDSMRSVPREVLAVALTALLAWVARPATSDAQVATAFYVSTGRDASDSHSCTQARNLNTPKRTLESALQCLTAGATLYLRAGTYTESVGDGDHDYSGTSWANATKIAAYAGETVTIKAPIGANFAIQIGRRSYVVIDRITVDGAGVVYDAVKLNGTSHHVRFQNGSIYNGTRQGVNIQDGAYGHELVNMNIDGNGSGGLDHGVYIATSNNLVDGSRIHGSSGYGVHVYNESCACANGNIVRNNRIYDNNLRAEGYGLLLGSGSGNAAYNNLIYGNHGGVQVAHGVPNGTKVYNNTVYDNRNWAGIIVQAEAVATQVKNNIIYRSRGDALVGGGSGTAMANNLIEVDPLFVNAAAGDFSLRSGSPAIDRGAPLPDVGVDFNRGPRPAGAGHDIGAHEHGSVPLPARPSNVRIVVPG